MSARNEPKAESNLGRSAARGSVVTLASQALSLSVQVVGLVVLARLLGPEVYGRLAIAVSFSVFATALILLGIPMAVAQSPWLSQAARSLLFILTGALGIVCGLVLALASAPISTYYNDDELGSLILWASALPVVGGLQSQFRLELILRLRFVALGIVDLVAQVVATVGAVIFAFRGDVEAAILTQLLGQAALQLLGVLCASKWLPSKPGNWTSEVVPILRVGSSLLGVSLLRESSRILVVPVMAARLPVAQVGIYDRLQQIAVSPANVAVDQLQRVMIPILSRVRAEPARMARFMRTGHLGLLYSVFSGYIVLAVLAPTVVNVLLGARWTDASSALRLLALGGGFMALGRSMQWLFVGSGATTAGLRFSLWSTPVMILVTLAGLPWGLNGVAMSTALSGMLYWPASLLSAARASGIDHRPLFSDFFRVFPMWCLPVAVASGLGGVLGRSSVMSLLLGLVGASVAALCVWLLSKSVRADLVKFKGFLKG